MWRRIVLDKLTSIVRHSTSPQAGQCLFLLQCYAHLGEEGLKKEGSEQHHALLD